MKRGNSRLTTFKKKTVFFYVKHLIQVFETPSTGRVHSRFNDEIAFWIAAGMALHAGARVPCRVEHQALTGFYKVSYGPKLEFYAYFSRGDFE